MAMEIAQTPSRNIVKQLQSALQLANHFLRRFEAVNAEKLRPDVDNVIHADIGTSLLLLLPIGSILFKLFSILVVLLY